MYSTKENVQQVIASLKAYDITHIVLSPGSRNAPFIHCFSQDPDFVCYTRVDERDAAFFALGLMQQLQRPVAICCTSGTALLNYGPAVAEAFYQELPLIIISGDRATAWIGQMDGQTIPQPHIFQSITKQSVQLPEIHNDQDRWYCQRLLHDALLHSERNAKGPVHINVPISDPFFDFSASTLPTVTPLSYYQCSDFTGSVTLRHQWLTSHRRMIIVGQHPYDETLTKQLIALAEQGQCIIVTEHLANQDDAHFIQNIDLCLTTISAQQMTDYQPDLVISCGGHLVSKRIKQFLRQHKPEHHWLINQRNELSDLFQSLTCVLHATPHQVFDYLITPQQGDHPLACDNSFSRRWLSLSEQVSQFSDHYPLPYSDLLAVKQLCDRLPAHAALQLANSSSVRYTQLFQLPAKTRVECNRGTSGIDGSLSTAIGFANLYPYLTYLIIGDLSFFYELSALWGQHYPTNLRILLLNNGGGALFHQLPGLSKSAALDDHIAAGHQFGAEQWVKAANITYLQAQNEKSLTQQMIRFTDNNEKCPMVLEVMTTQQDTTNIFQAMMSSLSTTIKAE